MLVVKRGRKGLREERRSSRGCREETEGGRGRGFDDRERGGGEREDGMNRMLIGEREERLLRRKFKEKHRDRVKETETSGQRGEEGGEEWQHQQDRAGKTSELFS